QYSTLDAMHAAPSSASVVIPRRSLSKKVTDGRREPRGESLNTVNISQILWLSYNLVTRNIKAPIPAAKVGN
ncbi:hypothetical protein AAULH_14186, partial [Lactobacillus helveticus MTCC 5463]